MQRQQRGGPLTGSFVSGSDIWERMAGLVSSVGSHVKLMPLFKLQTVGRKQLETLHTQMNWSMGAWCYRRAYGTVSGGSTALW